MLRKLFFSLILIIGIQGLSCAQTDFKQYYFNGKSFYREGKYNLAMESFKQAIPYDADNLFSEYASFYFALSAYHQGFYAVAKDMLNQLKKLHPNWDKMSEVDFWLGRIHMDNKEYFQGLKIWSSINNPTIQKSIEGYKYTYLSVIEDPETLTMMTEEYPNDLLIGKLLAKSLSTRLTDVTTRDQLDAVILKYNLNRSDYVHEAPPSYFKDKYSVSVLYPFMLSSLDPTPGKKKNQLILDLYEGMRMAADTLKKSGVDIDIRAYDTERKASTISRLLETEEIKNTDLIIGPFFPDENKLVQDFSMKNKINVLKPFTNNLEMIGINEFGFLMQPSYETVGTKSAEFLSKYARRRKNCIVFYGTSKKDSLLATSFMKKANEVGIKVVSAQRLTKDATGRIISMLTTATEYDKNKLPVEFKLKRDSLGSIFVASDDALIYSKVISSVETRGDSITVVGSETWLENNAMDYEKFQSQGIVLASPNFMNFSSAHYKAFAKKFIRTNGRTPSTYAALGYDLMMFAGNSLKTYGVYFQDGFDKEEVFPGALSEGYSFVNSHDNQCVPFVKFEKGELKVLNPR